MAWLDRADIKSVEELMGNLSTDYAEGFLSEAIRHHLGTGGKRLRAQLALGCSDVLKTEDSKHWAAACELLHNATLVHDDIQDEDLTRRNQPTVWAKYGSIQAINVGDIMLMLPYLAISQMSCASGKKIRLQTEVAKAACETIRGQALEQFLFSFSEAPSLLRNQYKKCIELKTAALFELSFVGPLILAEISEAEISQVRGLIRKLGQVFQLQDDVLDLYGSKGRDETGSDIKEGKMSALAVEHLVAFPSERQWLVNLLQKPRKDVSRAEIEDAISRFSLRALPLVLKEIEAQVSEALDEKNWPRNTKALPLLEVAKELSQLMLDPIRHLMGARQ